MSRTVNLYVAKTQLSDLVEQAARGEEIVIAKAGKPRARLVAYVPPLKRKPRKLGGWEGKVWMASDFDAPLPPEIMKYFTGEADDEDELVR